jgi:hypothetical protein
MWNLYFAGGCLLCMGEMPIRISPTSEKPGTKWKEVFLGKSVQVQVPVANSSKPFLSFCEYPSDEAARTRALLHQSKPKETKMRKLRTLLMMAVLALGAAFLGAPAASAEDTICRGAIGAVALDNLTVPDGATCTLTGTRLNGTIRVLTNATLSATGVRVNGNIQAEGARNVVVRGSSFVGGSVQIKQGQRATLDRVTINGDLQLDANRGALSISRNVVGSNLQAVGNSGGLTISANRIRQTLECKENNPAPTGSGNIAGEKKEQCAGL